MDRYNLVQPLVVRSLVDGMFEVIGGNQRLNVLRELGWPSAPCVVVDLDEADARLLSQALNNLHGADNLGLRGELLRQVLEKVSQEEILELLPETADSLQALVSLGQQDMAQYLEAWEKAQQFKLKHLQLQLTPMQLEVIEEAIATVMPKVDSFVERPVRDRPWSARVSGREAPRAVGC